jgi:hypothetical protein
MRTYRLLRRRLLSLALWLLQKVLRPTRFKQVDSVSSNSKVPVCPSSLPAKGTLQTLFLGVRGSRGRGIRRRLDVIMVPSRDAKAQEMVVSFYNRYKIGM